MVLTENDSLKAVKKIIEEPVVCAIDENLSFVAETDLCDFAVAATLNQGGQPVAFFSRVLQRNDVNQTTHQMRKKLMQ